MTEKQLEDELRSLADRLDPPDVPVGDDLDRGRRRSSRQRWAMGGAALATATVLALGAAVLPGPGDDSAVAPAGGDVTPTGPDVTPTPEPGETEVPDATPSETPDTTVDPDDPFGMMDPPATDRAMMVALRTAVAGHLDPEGIHISRREIRRPNNSGSSFDGHWSAIVQKIGWTVPGEDGLGLVAVGVMTAFDIDCNGSGPGGPTATCTERELAGLPVTLVEDEYEDDYYAYQRADGYVTTVATYDLYGNNSLTPVSGVDVTDAQLAAVLTDPALDIPGHPEPRTLDVLPGTLLRDVARDVLGSDTILAPESWAGEVGGYWSADVRSADGIVDVQLSHEVYGYADVDAPCDKTYATRCARREVDGGTVRIEHRRNRTGGGFDVTYEGPVRPIRVYVSPAGSAPATLSVDVAVGLATDPRLQR